MSIDWPEGFERMAPGERERVSKFQASLGQTTKSIEGELERMDVDDWRASVGRTRTKGNGLPLHDATPDDPGFVLRWTKKEEQFAVACDAYTRLRDNVRAVYLWVHETRMRGNRPVVTGSSQFAAARLPPGDEEREAVVTRQPPHEILGVAPDAPETVVKAAAKQLKKEHHPDQGGDEEQFKRIVRAEEELIE
jgi:DnaJ-domain-containing protein 1